MKTTFKRYDSSEGNVWKYVFDFGDAIAEAVLYKYEDFYERTVICISVQSGCPVGCTFCGTGKKFIRNLNRLEIVEQVEIILADMDIKDISRNGRRFQIMFMSMGEPFLNYDEFSSALERLNSCYVNAELLVSTIAPKKDEENYGHFIGMSQTFSRIGLQFSIHESSDYRRNMLIPYKNKYNLREIRDLGLTWHMKTNRPVYINYCVHEHNSDITDFISLKDLFSPLAFRFTFSVICSADETMKDAGEKNMDLLTKVSQNFLNDGYNVRVFDPAGQDDIGGGCGQLWHVQQWMKEH
jgi:23S rRNA (adenine2503-C2)-methyltransferase